MTNPVRTCMADDDELLVSALSLVLKRNGDDIGAAASPKYIVTKLTSWPSPLRFDRMS